MPQPGSKRAAACFLMRFCDTDKEKSPLHMQRGLVGCPVGLEPTISRSTIWRVNRLRHGHHIMRPKGLEPPAHCLEGSCSIHLSYGRTLLIPKGPLLAAAHSAHAARSIISYSRRSVKKKAEIYRGFFLSGKKCRGSRRMQFPVGADSSGLRERRHIGARRPSGQGCS